MTSRVLIALLVGAAGPAVADTMLPGGTTLMFGELRIHEHGAAQAATASSDVAAAHYFNLAHCACGQPGAAKTAGYNELAYAYQILMNPGSTNVDRPIQTWVGAGCDDPAMRAAQCHRVQSADVADLWTITSDGVAPEVPIYDLMVPVLPQQGCEPSQIAAEQWAMVDGNGDGVLDYFVGGPIMTDALPPPLPSGFVAAGKDGVIELDWTPPTDRSDIAGYQALCASGEDPASSAPPAPAYQTARQLCGESLDVPLVPAPIDAGPQAAPGPVALPQGIAQLDPAFLCGESDDPNASSIVIGGLRDQTPYLVMLVAFDKAGNASATYMDSLLTTRSHTDFWNDLHDRGSGVEGGFGCAAGGSGAGFALVLAVVPLLVRRRRGALAALLVVLPALALAKPSVSVEALDGDDSGKVTTAVKEAAEPHAKVVGKSKDPDVTIEGSVAKDDDGKKHLVLTLKGHGKKHRKIEIIFKSSTSKKFHKDLRAELEEKIDALVEDDRQEAALAEAEERARKEREEREAKERERKEREEREAREAKERERKDREDREAKEQERKDRERKHRKQRDEVAEEDDTPRKRHKTRDDEVTSDSDEEPRKKHRRHRRDAEPRHPVTQAALWADGGGAGLRRTLTYDPGAGAMPPPAVGTASFSAELEGEVYPTTFDEKSDGSGFGLAASFGKTLGLSIRVPGSAATAPIDEGHETIGARYRFVWGTSSIAVGASYWRMHYIADRGGLPMGTMLDMPDVDYNAFAPEVVAKLALAPKVGLALGAQVPLVFSAGPITSAAVLGSASIVAFGVQAGVDVALDVHYGLHFAALFDELDLSFTKMPRGLTGATDRTLGVCATFALLY